MFQSVLLAAAIVVMLPALSFAAVDTQQLGQMEQQIFAHKYPGEPVENRLSRLEKAVYGTSRDQEAPESRTAELGRFFKFPAGSGSTIAGQPSSGMPNNAPPAQPQQPLAQTPPNAQPFQPDGTRYPVVTAMESRVFQHTFEAEPLEVRLTRLERTVLNQAQQGTLQERTDQLKMVILGDTGTAPPSDLANANGGSPQIAMNPSTTAGPVSPDLMEALSKVEQKVLRQTFPNDSVESRLSRMEMKLFNSTAPEMPPEDRLYRIVSVLNAKGSSRMEQAYRGPGNIAVPGGRSGGYYSSSGSAGASALGSMLLMILMSLL